MARMVRKQIYITEEQERLLKERAREGNRTEAEVIRGFLDLALSGDIEREYRRRRAWKRLEALMRERAAIVAPQTGRTWTREEIYEERLDELAARRHEHSRLQPGSEEQREAE
jgi:hypothetical protein